MPPCDFYFVAPITTKQIYEHFYINIELCTTHKFCADYTLFMHSFIMVFQPLNKPKCYSFFF